MPGLSVSIVIPVYNEQNNLPGCLEAIKALTINPHEVIVVDNGSTDKTAKIALKYPFVKLISEPKRGQVFASFKGFSIAKSEIVAKIDADSRVQPGWLEEINKVFDDGAVDAVWGNVNFYDLLFPGISSKIDRYTRRFIYRHFHKSSNLYGANMAIRKSAWDEVKGSLCLRLDLQEDNDLAIHLHFADKKIVYDDNLTVGVATDRLDNGFISGYKYYRMLPKTYKEHGIGQLYLFYYVIFVIAIFYLPLRLSRFLFKKIKKTDL